MAREDRDSQYGGGSYSSENNRSDRGQSYGGGGGDAREQRRSEQYTSQTAKDLAAGVGSGGIGTLADPREKMDYFGSTVFGPSRKYTGSFLDNILGRGYRAVQPYAPDQFQSRLSQAGGLGKSVFGGILGLINPMAGMLFKIGSSLPNIRNYNTLADYAKNEFGLFQEPSINMTPQQVFFDPTNFNNTAMNLQGVSPTEGIMQVAGLTDKQKKLLDQRRGMYPDILGAQEMLDNISSEDDPNDPATIEDIQKYYGVV